MNAYSELYINDARNNMGQMFHTAYNILNYDINDFFSMFLISGIAANFESGNPKYITGMSGYELVYHVLKKSGLDISMPEQDYSCARDSYFWTGWIMAYYQWLKNIRFEEMMKNGLDPKSVSELYILHEADESKFVSIADKIFEKEYAKKETKLAELRKLRGYTQKMLSIESGVSLRMIQLYEQRQNDISKAGVDIIIKLSKSLGCKVEDLIFEKI